MGIRIGVRPKRWLGEKPESTSVQNHRRIPWGGPGRRGGTQKKHPEFNFSGEKQGEKKRKKTHIQEPEMAQANPVQKVRGKEKNRKEVRGDVRMGDLKGSKPKKSAGY